MAIGIPINPGNLNQQAGQLVVNLRNACQAVISFQNTLVAVSQSGLVDAGFSPADATDLMTRINELNTLAEVYFGQATQGTPFNFSNVGASMTGGN